MKKIIYIFIFLIIFIVWDNQLFTIHRALADQKITFEEPKMLNNFGMPGNIDTPTAESFPDGQFSASSAIFGGTIRTNLSFQISENITAAFRYSRIPSVSGDHRGYFWDRSFDVHYRAFKEKKFLPAIAIGLRDFVGTGLYSSEYIAASKSIGKEIKISAGLGWGRMAGTNSFSNVFGLGNDRTGITADVGGTFNLDQFFSGKNSPIAIRVSAWRFEASQLRRAMGLLSSSIESSSRSPPQPFMTPDNFQPRSNASPMPVFIP